MSHESQTACDDERRRAPAYCQRPDVADRRSVQNVINSLILTKCAISICDLKKKHLFKRKIDINDYIVESDKWDNYGVVLSAATENDNMHSYIRALFTAKLEPAGLGLCLCLDFLVFPITLCVFGCQYQCNRLPGNSHLRNDQACVGRDCLKNFTHSFTYVCHLRYRRTKMIGRDNASHCRYVRLISQRNVAPKAVIWRLIRTVRSLVSLTVYKDKNKHKQTNKQTKLYTYQALQCIVGAYCMAKK